MQKLTAIAKEVLSHIEIYLNQLNDEDYQRPLQLLSQAAIGSHTRHILDGFCCLMRQQSSGIISYDKRERDKKIECEVYHAKEKVNEIKNFVSSLDQNEEFNFEVNYNDQVISTNSCLKREMIHNIEHVIHHLAIVKIALLHYHPKIKLPAAFGVAPSTLRYWKEKKIKKTQDSSLKAHV